MLFTTLCLTSSESDSCSSSVESSANVRIQRSQPPGERGRGESGLNPTNTPTLSILGSQTPESRQLLTAIHKTQSSR